MSSNGFDDAWSSTSMRTRRVEAVGGVVVVSGTVDVEGNGWIVLCLMVMEGVYSPMRRSRCFLLIFPDLLMTL